MLIYRTVATRQSFGPGLCNLFLPTWIGWAFSVANSSAFKYHQKGNWSEVLLMTNRTSDSWRRHFLFHTYIPCCHGEAAHKWFCHWARSLSHAQGESQHFVKSGYTINFLLPQSQHQINWDSSTWGWGRWLFVPKAEEGVRGGSIFWKRKGALMFALPQAFDGMMKDTKSFVSFLILYLYGQKAEFPNNKSKIMFVLLYVIRYWVKQSTRSPPPCSTSTQPFSSTPFAVSTHGSAPSPAQLWAC